MKKLLLLQFFIFSIANSQVTFDKIPVEKQLVARDLQTNQGTIQIEGKINIGDNYNLEYSSWQLGEPNNTPPPEDKAEIINSLGKWNDANASETQASYVEYDGLIDSLADFIYLGQYGGHSYFKNTNELNWEEASVAAINEGGYLSSHHTSEENSAVTGFGWFRGWIGLYQDLESSDYSEPFNGWKWVAPTPSSTSEYSSIKVKLLKNEELLETYEQNLSYSDEVAIFSFSININAELSKYRVIIEAEYNGIFESINNIGDIVAGDTFIVQGQSNAAAPSYNGSSSEYESEFIRVYSGGNTSSSGMISNDSWYYGQGDGNEGSNGNTGQWGLVLARRIVDEIGVPVAIFNGAHGGQPISFFQAPEDYNSSTASNYGRMYYRLNKTGLKDSVRAILWSQGEADAFANGLSTEQYKDAFVNLKNSWSNDLINLERVYVFQTRECNCGTSSTGRLLIKEAQRQLAFENDDISIMPTTGMTTHSDNCHYPFTNGYETFGNRIYKPVMRDLFSYSYEEEIDAPMILSANLTSTQTLVIETSAENLMINTTDTSAILNKVSNDYILTNANNVSISSFEIQGNSIVFNLDGNPGSSPVISFYGIYAGIENNITNSNGLELVNFSYYNISGGTGGTGGNVAADQDKKPGVVFVENGDNQPQSGRLYRSSAQGGASRDGNGNSNGAFANIGDWTFDVVISEKTPEDAAQSFGGFTESGHPLYTGGDGNWSTISEGMGAAGWGSFAANAYNRAAGLGGVSLGFNTLSGPQVGAAGGIDGGNVGQFSAGWASRAIGNISTATGFRNTASGQASVSLGNYNYATGDSSIALGKENWAEGASAMAIGYKNHAAGAGSVSLGQENIAWGTTNFTSGYQNVAGDTSADVGTAGSATAMGVQTTASGRSSFTSNKNTSALNQASAALGISTTADNFGMLAIGVNNAAGIGDTTVDPDNYGGYYYADGEYTGSNPGVAFVIGNGDLNSSNGVGGENPSNAFIVNYDGSATLSGDLTINSDIRLKSNIASISSALSKILLLDGKKYSINSGNNEIKIGLLAQEVMELFPELVKKANDSEGTLSVNYQGLIPVLINAIKEQQIQIQKLIKKLKD